ncbi:MAG TPA: 3D domain-containing protein [Tepidisphaeraceae bacterium]|nr:3D domain-containing protein [Tepidisphaeraceae bacterium]
MRRSAINYTGPVLCAVLAVALVGAIGRADVKPAVTPVTLSNARAAELTARLVSAPLVKLPESRRADLLGAAPKSRTMVMEVTAYCPCTRCCGPQARGVTASGRHVSHNSGRFVAADTSVLPFRTKLVIPGYANHRAVEVLDRGGAIKGNKLDVFFPTHQEALKWGRQKIEVVVVDPPDRS